MTQRDEILDEIIGRVPGSTTGAAQGERIVDTTAGQIRGGVTLGVESYLGVPYGASTEGPRRFLPPIAPEPWSGVRDALEFGSSCPQMVLQSNQRTAVIDRYGEDCLVANIWTLDATGGRNRPVMVWLHGGGWQIGSSNHARSSGVALARRSDVVVVGLNHRLGVLGFLSLEAFGGDQFAGSSNAGVLDLCLALEWIRDNIDAFGGDPGRVMVFGESGGGAKVSTLLAMPRARGLFHCAVIQSGSMLRAHEPDAAKACTEDLLHQLNLDASAFRDLQSLPVDDIVQADIELMKARAPGTSAQGFMPAVDGDTLPEHPGDALSNGTAADIPLIIGTTKDEASLFTVVIEPTGTGSAPWSGNWPPLRRVPADVDFDGAKELLSRIDAAAAELFDDYCAIVPDADPISALIAVSTGRARQHANEQAERKIAGGKSPVWMYIFSHEGHPVGTRKYAAHALELDFLFGNFTRTERSPANQLLSAQLGGAWSNFARDEEPSTPDLPEEWPPYTIEDRATMIFDTPISHVESDPFGRERELWKRFAKDPK